MLHLLKLKFKMKKYLLLLISLVVTSTAMSQQISLTNFNTEVFIENFSTKSPLFSFETTSENYFIVDDGDLFLSRNNKLSDYTIFSSTPFSEENYKLKTSIKLIATNSKESYVGILLNTQLDGNGLVSVEINSKKEYRVRQINNGDSKYLSGNRDNEGWIANDFIKENGEFNYIDILCYKGRYDLYFNFQYVNTFESPEYITGRFGFLIGAQSQARIDYIHVHKEGGKVSTVDFNNANDKILKLENDILSLQKDINSNKTLVDQLRAENSNSSKELNNNKQKEAILRAEKEALENKINGLDLKLDEANAHKNKIASESSDFKKAILSYEKTSNNLEKKNSELINQLDLKINELSKIQTNLSNSSSELNKKTIEVSSLSTQLKKSEQELKDATNSNINLKSSNGKYESETLGLNRKIVNQENQINNSKTELKKLEDQVEKLNSQIISLKNSTNNIENEKRELNREIVNQSNQIKSQDLKISDLNSEINSMSVQKEKIKAQLTDANSKKNALTKKNSQLNSKLVESKKTLANQKAKSQNLDIQIKNIKSKNLKKQETIDFLNSKNKTLNDSISSLFKDYSFLIMKDEELKELTKKHNKLTIKSQNDIASMKKLNLENQKLNSQLDEQKQIAGQFAESYRYELEKSKKFQEEILNFQSEINTETSNKTNSIYKIQLGIFDEEINIEYLELITKINTENNQFIYLSGRFENYSSARTYLLKVNELGFNNAFIVKF